MPSLETYSTIKPNENTFYIKIGSVEVVVHRKYNYIIESYFKPTNIKQLTANMKD